MINVKMPKTNLVECVFALRTNNNVFQADERASSWDKYDRHVNTSGLKKYVYRVPNHLKGQIGLGDTVVVHCKTGYQLCLVVTEDALSNYPEESFAPVVAKVDMVPYWDEVDRMEQLKYMRVHIEEKKKELEKMVTYEILAEKNPEFKELLEAFKQAGGVI